MLVGSTVLTAASWVRVWYCARRVGVDVIVGVFVMVGVLVLVAVATVPPPPPPPPLVVAVAVGVLVGVEVGVEVLVGTGVFVKVGVGVSVGAAPATNTPFENLEVLLLESRAVVVKMVRSGTEMKIPAEKFTDPAPLVVTVLVRTSVSPWKPVAFLKNSRV